MSTSLIAAPDALVAASADLSGIGEALGEAMASAGPATTNVASIAADEVSAAVAQVFGTVNAWKACPWLHRQRHVRPAAQRFLDVTARASQTADGSSPRAASYAAPTR
ncbi:PE family protein [Mycobacterium alsense]|nr:PE family protein [Mycobacterium alsense]